MSHPSWQFFGSQVANAAGGIRRKSVCEKEKERARCRQHREARVLEDGSVVIYMQQSRAVVHKDADPLICRVQSVHCVAISPRLAISSTLSHSCALSARNFLCGCFAVTVATASCDGDALLHAHKRSLVLPVFSDLMNLPYFLKKYRNTEY